jgi:aldehyde:ferredoxin oxidoreductase
MFTIDFGTDVQLFADAINLITGMEIDKTEYYRIGERINNLERCFNLRQGITGKDDVLPRRIREEAVVDSDSGPLDIREMLAQYYDLRGWDEAGVPTQKRLAALDLDPDSLPETEGAAR